MKRQVILCSVLVIAVFLVLAPTLVSDTIRGGWGAIAYSQATSKTGNSQHFLTKEAAAANARRACGADDCHTVLTFENECAAIALGSNNVMGKGKAATWQAAETKAVEHCSADGGKSCKAIKHECSHE